MFVQLKKGQLAYNKETGEHGKIIGVDNVTYAVEVIVEQNKEEGTRTTKVVEFPKVKTAPYRKPRNGGKGKRKGFREQKAVHEFHSAFNYPQSNEPVALSAEDIFKRVVFIQEELIELMAASVDSETEFYRYMEELSEKEKEAYKKELPKVVKREHTVVTDNIDFERTERERVQRIVEQTDALTDINVFVQGTGDMMGVHLLPLFEIVMKANMSKLDDNGEPIYNEFGKIQKSNNFTPPEPMLQEEIERQIEVAKKRAEKDGE